MSGSSATRGGGGDPARDLFFLGPERAEVNEDSEEDSVDSENTSALPLTASNSPKKRPRPRGAAPKGMKWSYEYGKWVLDGANEDSEDDSVTGSTDNTNTNPQG